MRGMESKRQVILVPGLFSPRWHMAGLRRSLRHERLDAETWDDALVFGDLDKSVERLRQTILDRGPGLGVASHSFGDWLLRQALHGMDDCPVRRVVSLVPVVTTSFAARLVNPLVGRFVPEVAVMSDEERASAAKVLPAAIDHLIVWARIDPWIRKPGGHALSGANCTTVFGTHNSVLWQPCVQRTVAKFLLR